MWSRCRCVSRMCSGRSGGGSVQAERADARAGVEHERGAVGERHLHARRVAAVAHGLRARGRDRPARAPDADLHAASSSAGQKTTIAPAVAVGPDEREAAGLDRVRWSPSAERMQKRVVRRAVAAQRLR